MTMNTKKITAFVAAAALLFGFAGCSYDDKASKKRKDAQASVTLKDSLEITNLETKLKRENDPNAVRYVYLISFAQPIGYYVVKGKVSSSGSQLAPEDEVIDNCDSSCGGNVLDSSQDDGTYGTGDPGIFFFTADGTMVSTTLDYIESDAPLPIDVPRLGGEK